MIMLYIKALHDQATAAHAAAAAAHQQQQQSQQPNANPDDVTPLSQGGRHDEADDVWLDRRLVFLLTRTAGLFQYERVNDAG